MGTRNSVDTDKDELVRLMFGEHTPVHLKRKPVSSGKTALEVKDLNVFDDTGAHEFYQACKGYSGSGFNR